MSGLGNLIDRIRAKAEDKRESILEEARKEAEEKKSEAREKAEKEKERIIAKGEKEAEQTKRRELANARKEAREKKLEAREDIIQEVFEEAREELNDLQGDNEEYRETLKNLITLGGAAVGGGKLEVSVLESDEEILSDSEVRDMEGEISEETGKETDLKVVSDLEDASGGAIVEKRDGSISSNNTFEARLKRMKSSLRSEIADILFES